MMKKTIIVLSFLMVASIAWGQRSSKVTDDDVLASMKKASAYMANEVSCNGGYLWYYKEDLTEVFGEVPAIKYVSDLSSSKYPWSLSLFRSLGSDRDLPYV